MFWSILGNVLKNIGKVALESKAKSGGAGSMASAFGANLLSSDTSQRKPLSEEEYNKRMNDYFLNQLTRMNLFGQGYNYFTNDPYSPWYMGGGR